MKTKTKNIKIFMSMSKCMFFSVLILIFFSNIYTFKSSIGCQSKFKMTIENRIVNNKEILMIYSTFMGYAINLNDGVEVNGLFVKCLRMCVKSIHNRKFIVFIISNWLSINTLENVLLTNFEKPSFSENRLRNVAICERMRFR